MKHQKIIFLLVLLILLALLCACGDKETVTTKKNGGEIEPSVTTEPSITTENSTTTEPSITTKPLSTTGAEQITTPSLAPSFDCLKYENKKVTLDFENAGYRLSYLEEGKEISVPLPQIEANTPNSLLDEYGFIRFAKNDIQSFSSAGYALAVRKEAFYSYVDMMNAFAKDLGEIGTFIVINAYCSDTYKYDYALGYTLSMKIKDSDGSAQYPFNSLSKQFYYGGEKITYMKWFKMNCAKYGFVFCDIGANEDGIFRYVGKVAAPYMSEKSLTVESLVSEIKQGGKEGLAVNDIDGAKWTLYYVESKEPLTLTLNGYYEFSSTDGGFIIAEREGSETAFTE